MTYTHKLGLKRDRAGLNLTLAAGLAALLLAPAMAGAKPAPPRTLFPLPNAQQMTQLCDKALAQAGTQVKQIETMNNNAGFLAAWNRLAETIEQVDGNASLIANVFTDKATREAADACSTKLTRFGAALYQNEAVFKNLSAATARDAVDQQFKRLAMNDFEDTGVALAEDKRKRMKQILDRIEELRQAFDKNVREDGTTVVISADEAQGMPESWSKPLKKDDKGNFIVGLNYPAYIPYMQLGKSEPARQRLWTAKQNEGGKKNIEILAEIAKLRLEMAGLFGQKSFGDYQTRRRMAGSAQNVTTFLDQVKSKVQELEKQEIADLAQAKAKETNTPVASTKINRWDVQYYSEKLRKERYAIDQEQLRKFFPTQASVDFSLKIASNLYGVKFQQVKVSAWHEDVRYYDVLDAKTNRFIGGIYLDLFPRPDKYNHAAAWGVRGTSTALNRKPMSVLVTNFNREGLTHDELETLLHEFGHVLHGVLSTTRYIGLAGTNVKRDFVEAPSQMFEEWARRPQTLALFKEVCPSCPVLSNEQIKKLDDARKFGRGIRYARQHLYAAWDMQLHSTTLQDPLELWAKMEGATPLGHVPGTMFPAGFGHIPSGYGAGYYGYMWSEVLALDMLSAFGNNLMDPKVGRRYRDIILASGGTREPMILVKELLGREPNPQAFFAEITGQR